MKERYLGDSFGISLHRKHNWGITKLLNPRITRQTLSLSGRIVFKNYIIVASPAFNDWEDYGKTTTHFPTRNVDPENHLMGYSYKMCWCFDR